MKHYCIIIITFFSFFAISACKSKKSTTSAASTAGNVTTASLKADVVEGINLGNKAPDFQMANPKDEFITLSSLKGKLVLIDFWASWCGPCRQENPDVVAAYTKYHTVKFKNGDGFEVLSVSLDNNKASWLKAIEKDNLTWPYHVADMQGWNNAVAKQYRVHSIPTNLLIDGNGIIIAKSLHGKALEKAIEANIK